MADTLIQLEGQVLSTKNNDPLIGATVQGLGNQVVAISDASGRFKMTIPQGSNIVVSFIGYQKSVLKISKSGSVVVKLDEFKTDLDEVVVMGYGTTSKRFNTGNIAKISSKEIENQPVSNPLAALIGRTPGLLITQTSGVGGSGFKIMLRGQNSITQGTEPFFIIDGVPFAPGNGALNQIANAANKTSTLGLSPLNLINPNDIESIEVLKDADATAIYGSRGANGVVLITTKRGKMGKATVSGKLNYGVSNAINVVDVLNTKQYLEVRREAFANDGITPTPSNAPDLFYFDTTRNNDLKNLLTGELPIPWTHRSRSLGEQIKHSSTSAATIIGRRPYSRQTLRTGAQGSALIYSIDQRTSVLRWH